MQSESLYKIRCICQALLFILNVGPPPQALVAALRQGSASQLMPDAAGMPAAVLDSKEQQLLDSCSVLSPSGRDSTHMHADIRHMHAAAQSAGAEDVALIEALLAAVLSQVRHNSVMHNEAAGQPEYLAN